MLVIQAVDMVVASEKIDAGAKQDSAWLWAEPELVSQVPTTSEESAIAVQDGPELGRVRCVGVRRQAGVQPCARGPLDLQSLGGLAEGYWTSPKPVGLTRVRCDRQHGRPLPPPPPPRAAPRCTPMRLASPWTLAAWTCSVPSCTRRGWIACSRPRREASRGDQAVKLQRKVYARRNGPQVSTESLAIQLCQRGWTRANVCPRTSFRPAFGDHQSGCR